MPCRYVFSSYYSLSISVRLQGIRLNSFTPLLLNSYKNNPKTKIK